MITLDVHGDRGFSATFPYDPNVVDQMKLTGGFTWHRPSRAWLSEGPEVLLDLDRYSVKYVLTQRAHARALQFREQLSTILDLKARPLSEELYSFQSVDSRIAAVAQRCLVGHPRGMGKTKIALDAASLLGCQTVLVLIMFEGTLVVNWDDEVKKWHPEWTSVIVPDSKPERLRFWKEASANVWIANSQKVLLADWPLDAEWDCVIIDEVGRAKNHKTVTHKKLRAITRAARYCFGVGSPMEMRVQEIPAVFDLIRPALFGGAWRFREQHLTWDYTGAITGMTPHGNQLLKERLAPWMLYRPKDILGLPPVLTNTRYVELGPNEKGVYTQLKKQFRQWLVEKKRSLSEANALTQLLRLQQFVDSRFLLEDNREQVRNFGTQPLFTGSKYHALKEEIDEWQGKVVVFTRFAEMASLLVLWLDTPYYVIGDEEFGLPHVKSRDRVALVKQFNADSSAKVLVSTDAGAYGLNIQANLIVHYDQLWNPLRMMQRRDRVHGIGRGMEGQRTNELNLVCRGTIDEGMLRTLEARADVFRDVIEGSEEAAATQRLGPSALRKIIEGRSA